MKNIQADILIIGAGISGSVIAERYASIGKKVVVLEKRDHIGGNCYDYVDENGILCSKYGAHIFHTEYEDVWEYVNQFSDWYEYKHKVVSKVGDKLVPVPVNITTVNEIFGLNIQSEEEMEEWLEENRVKIGDPKNGEEAVLSKVGPVLYEKLFKDYTYKQWEKYPVELAAEVLNRIPVRTNFEDGYFSDKYQALPRDGYTKLFENMLSHPNITVLLNTDYFDVRDSIGQLEKVFYTGPIDRYFDFKFSVEDKLEYRSINFVSEVHDVEYYQPNSVVNYPQMEDGMFTRIIEYKHFRKSIEKKKTNKTVIVKEFTVDVTSEDQEPYYPVLKPGLDKVLEKYKEAADKLQNIHFVGRLANYKYFNMDQAFKNALDLFYELNPKVYSKSFKNSEILRR